MSLIEVKNVDFDYKVEDRHVPVLRDMNFEVSPGEFVAFQGASGSGKSTLLYLLGCLLEPDRGEIFLSGTSLYRLSGDQRAFLRNQRIGFVFQQFHLLARATVLENILLPTFYPCELSGQSSDCLERAISIAQKLGLGDHLEHRPNQLSGGQQQRVAIARALMNDVDLILADEPTGNLDSKNAKQTMEIFKELNQQGKTIILITHDPEIASQASKIFHLKDGMITNIEVLGQKRGDERKANPLPVMRDFRSTTALMRACWSLFPLSFANILRNRARSVLTMLGITIGIASVLAMVTLGDFTKRKILESYESLGVNKLLIKGYPYWKLSATERVDIKFQAFDWEKDILPLREVFPEIDLMSPVLRTYNVTANFNGDQISNDIFLRGVNAQFAAITNSKLIMGRFLDPFQVETHSSVCIIGSDIAKRLFTIVSPIGQILYFTTGAPDPYTCLIIGVLEPKKTNSEWDKPNSQILIPYTLLPSLIDNWWDSQIHQVVVNLKPGSDVERTAHSIRAYFVQKYGNSGRFDIDSDAILLAQMKKFLNLFTILLASIALISLIVGGIGIANMMLVSVSERFKEIGLRKALGATDLSVRIQLLMEAMLLCAMAGIAGAVFGFAVYESLIFGASHFVAQLKFEWVFNGGAFLVSGVSIIVVGIGSGIVPALRAERLQVIEALRSE